MTHPAVSRRIASFGLLALVSTALVACGAAAGGPEQPAPASSTELGSSRTGGDIPAPNVNPPAPPHRTPSAAPKESRVVADGASPDGVKPTGVIHSVSMKGGVFTPRALSIDLGDTVEFTWESGTVASVTSGLGCQPDMVFDSGEHAAPWRYRVTFLRPGIFGFYSAPTCDEMNGALYVKG